jgi:eukaryotic-like serine/threonine-protein kinase
MPGVLLGRYEVSEELGHGGMGVVYRARDRQLGRDVAIKLVHTEGAHGETLAARLLREAQALAQLSHPNVVAVHDVGRTQDGVFVAMEFVHGTPADIWLNERKPPWREVLRVFLAAARGLAAAHAVGLIHRDFKPGNLMLGDDGRVRVLDFGLARAATYGPTTSITRSSSASTSRTGTSASSGSDAAAGAGTTSGSDAAAGAGAGTRSGSDAATGAGTGSGAGAGAGTRSGSGSDAGEIEVDATSPPDEVGDRPTEAESPPPTPATHPPSLLDSPLTELGSIIGTPPYMAPEQHMRALCDARTDQFSFCASLYRGLYHQRPFAGTKYATLKHNILAGKVRPPPPGTKVPAWLHAIVLRGLSVDPARRWPSMAALIEALERDPDATRRRVIAGAAAVVLAGAGGSAWMLTRSDPADACAVDTRELAGAWDNATKQRIAAAFARTNKPYAEDALASLSRSLDDYTSRWARMRTDASLATRVRGTQSAELLDLRMECLQRRLDSARALVDVLADADAEVVSRAPQAAANLPSIDDCADTEALRAPVRPPDPQTRARVEAAHKTVAKADALWNAGRYTAAQELITPAIAEAKTIGYRPLEAQALLVGARTADSSSDFTAASTLFKEAAIAAEAGRDDHTAALARNALVWVVGERLGRYDEAKELARDAEAKIERLDRSDLLQADLDQKLAAIYLAQGDYQEAERRGRRVLDIRQKALGTDHAAIATALGDLADVAVQTGRYDEAIDLYRRALAIVDRVLGPDHPYAGTLHINLAATYRNKGDNRAALAELERARAISESALGPEHTHLATIALNIGGIHLDEHRLAEASAAFTKARELWTKAAGADHPNVATAEFRLGQVALAEGKPEQATASFHRVFEAWRGKLGPDHPSLSAALTGLGDAAMATKLPATAIGHYQDALALLEKAMGRDNPALADLLTSLATAQLASGKRAAAVASLERALGLREAEGDTAAIEKTRQALANARRRR